MNYNRYDSCRSINVCIEGSEKDCELFGLLPLTYSSEEFHIYKGNNNMANLLKDMGIFESTSEARKAGYNKPIPFGYTELRLKHYRNVHILNTKDLV